MGWSARETSVYQGLFAVYIDDQYNNARIANDLYGSGSSWWLRTPGLNPMHAVVVFADGGLSMMSFVYFDWVDFDDWKERMTGVRPALWLYLDSESANVAYAYGPATTVSPELRAAASAFAEVLQGYIDNHGISTADSHIGVNGAHLINMDSSGIPILFLQYQNRYVIEPYWPQYTVLYRFADGRASQFYRGSSIEMGDSTWRTQGSNWYFIVATEQGATYLGVARRIWMEEFYYFYALTEGRLVPADSYLIWADDAEWLFSGESPEVVLASLRGMME